MTFFWHNSNFMKLFALPNFRLFVFYILLIAFACCPVWIVPNFINQDGSAHLYSSYIMLELLKGNPAVGEIYAFNSFSVPNSSGHWLLVSLLNFFSSFTATKIIVTLTFAGFVASVGWLRWKTVGNEGLKTSLLIATAIAFNWLWFVGFYNFMIGVIGFTFTTGLYYFWREKMNLTRAIILSLLLLLVYFSHIVSFVILAGSIFLLAVSAPKTNFKRNIIWTLAAFLPVLPLAVIYKILSENGGGFFPVWRNLENPYSLLSWFSQFRTADPFVLISRKTFPFSTANSNFFAIFTPILWIFAAVFSLSLATFFQKDKQTLSKTNLTFPLLFFLCILTALFAPDDFGLTNGGILRERLLLCGMIFFIPVFRAENSLKLKRFAQICLLFVIVFQTAAVWEYSLRTNAEVKEFLAAQTVIPENETLASVIIIEDVVRFHSVPSTQMGNILGIEKNIIVWDNYEIGHYLFPIVAKNPADKQFVFELTSSNVFSLKNPGENLDEKLTKLDSFMSVNNGKIKTLLVWGKDSRVETVLSKWFEPEPFYENGKVRLFQHK